MMVKMQALDSMSTDDVIAVLRERIADAHARGIRVSFKMSTGMREMDTVDGYRVYEPDNRFDARFIIDNPVEPVL